MDNDCLPGQPQKAWYAYNGTGPTDQISSYSLVSIKPMCRTGHLLGAIYAPYGGQYPEFLSANLIRYISNGLVIGTPQPHNPMGSKKYVYFKQ